jgi:hypothetical protein
MSSSSKTTSKAKSTSTLSIELQLRLEKTVGFTLLVLDLVRLMLTVDHKVRPSASTLLTKFSEMYKLEPPESL